MRDTLPYPPLKGEEGILPQPLRQPGQALVEAVVDAGVVVVEFLVAVGHAERGEPAGEAAGAVDEVVLVEPAAIDEQRLQALQVLPVALHQGEGIAGAPLRPALLDQLAGVGIDRQADAEGRFRVGIVGRRHGEDHQGVDIVPGGLPGRLEGLDEVLDRALARDPAQRGGHVLQIGELEGHVAGMAGRTGPETGVLQRVHDRAVAARALAEHGAPALPAAPEVFLHRRDELGDEDVLPRAHHGGVDVLVAAQARVAVGKGDDAGLQPALAVQPVEALGHVLAEILPAGVRQAAAGIAGETHQEGQALPAVPVRGPHIDRPAHRIAEDIVLQELRLHEQAMDGPGGMGVARGHEGSLALRGGERRGWAAAIKARLR